MSELEALEELHRETLPLPLRGAVERALAADDLQRFNLIFDIYKALLQFVAAAAIGLALRRNARDAKLDQRLESLLRPALGDWNALAQLALQPLLPLKLGEDSLESRLANGWLKTSLGEAARTAFENVSQHLEQRCASPPTPLPRNLTAAIFFDQFICLRNRSNLGHGITGNEGDTLELGAALARALPALARVLMPFLQRFPLTWLETRIERSGGVQVEIRDLMQAEVKKSVSAGSAACTLEHLFLRAPGSTFAPLVDLHPLLVYRECADCNKSRRVFFLGEESQRGPRYVSFACGHQIASFDLTADLLKLAERAGGPASPPSGPRHLSPAPGPVGAKALEPASTSGSPAAVAPDDNKPRRMQRRPRRRFTSLPLASRAGSIPKSRWLPTVAAAAVAAVAVAAITAGGRGGFLSTRSTKTGPADLAVSAPPVPVSPPGPRSPTRTTSFEIDEGAKGIPSANLFGIWGDGNGFLVIVGERGTVLVRDGNQPWRTVAKSEAGGRKLLSVWGSDSNDIYVVGDRGVVLHGSDRGSRWQRSRIAEAGVLRTVTGSAADDVIVGSESGRMWRSADRGARWSPVRAVARGVLRGATSVGGTRWMAGDDGTIVESRDGQHWSQEKAGTDRDLNGIWGASALELFAVGGTPNIPGRHGDHEPLILHSTDGGRNWNKETVEDTHNIPATVVGSGDRIFAAGIGNTIIERDPGGVWHPVSTPNPSSGNKPRLMAMWADRDGIYVVGLNGTVLRSR